MTLFVLIKSQVPYVPYDFYIWPHEWRTIGLYVYVNKPCLDWRHQTMYQNIKKQYFGLRMDSFHPLTIIKCIIYLLLNIFNPPTIPNPILD